MQTIQHSYDTIIVGGGMVGMSLGIALAQQGLPVALVEKTSMPQQLETRFDGRVSAIALGSYHLLKHIGAWKWMEAEAQPIHDIRVSDGDTPFFLHYDHQEIGNVPFGYIVENRYIRHGLWQAVRNLPNLQIIEHATPTGFTADSGNVTLRLEDGRELVASLLVGADGKESSIRAMAGIENHQGRYAQKAIVATIEHENPHNGLAQERFLPAGPFAVLPMTGNRSSLVWVEPEDRANAYLDLSDDEFAEEITERIGTYLGTIQAKGPRFCYPLSLMHAKSYIAPRLALIGDAAHAIHPIAGQGVNLGFRDVAVLAELILDKRGLGLDIGSQEMLAHYQRWRRFDNVTMMAVTDSLNRLFLNGLLPVRLARGLGLMVVGKMPPVKRFFMRHAMGLVGDLPELLKA